MKKDVNFHNKTLKKLWGLLSMSNDNSKFFIFYQHVAQILAKIKEIGGQVANIFLRMASYFKIICWLEIAIIALFMWVSH